MTDPTQTSRRRLPDVALPPVAGGPAVPLRAHRRAAVLVLLNAAADAASADAATADVSAGAFLRQLADAAPALADWDGRVLVIVGGDAARADGMGAAATPELSFPVLADPPHAVAAAAGVAPPAVVIADQWGEVHVAAPARPGQAWLPLPEIEQWLRFLAVRCAG